MSKIMILTDTRQQKEKHITKHFDNEKVLHIQTKLESGDYMAIRYDVEKGFYKDYSVIIDTKKDLLEVCSNLAHTTEHQRVVKEVELAHKLGVKEFVFLIGEKNIENAEDIKNWSSKHTKVKGETLLKIMHTFSKNHNCKFVVCKKNEMGKIILRLLRKER